MECSASSSSREDAKHVVRSTSARELPMPISLISMADLIHSMERRFTTQIAQLQRDSESLNASHRLHIESSFNLVIPQLLERVSQLEVVHLAGDRQSGQNCANYREKFSLQIAKLQEQSDYSDEVPRILDRLKQLERAQEEGSMRLAEVHNHYKQFAHDRHAPTSYIDQIGNPQMDGLHVMSRLQDLDLQHRELSHAQDKTLAAVEDLQDNLIPRIRKVEAKLNDITSATPIEASRPGAANHSIGRSSLEQRVIDIAGKVENLLICFPDVEGRIEAQEESFKRLRHRQLSSTTGRSVFEDNLRESHSVVRELSRTDQLQEQFHVVEESVSRVQAEGLDFQDQLHTLAVRIALLESFTGEEAASGAPTSSSMAKHMEQFEVTLSVVTRRLDTQQIGIDELAVSLQDASYPVPDRLGTLPERRATYTEARATGSLLRKSQSAIFRSATSRLSEQESVLSKERESAPGGEPRALTARSMDTGMAMNGHRADTINGKGGKRWSAEDEIDIATQLSAQDRFKLRVAELVQERAPALRHSCSGRLLAQSSSEQLLRQLPGKRLGLEVTRTESPSPSPRLPFFRLSGAAD